MFGIIEFLYLKEYSSSSSQNIGALLADIWLRFDILVLMRKICQSYKHDVLKSIYGEILL